VLLDDPRRREAARGGHGRRMLEICACALAASGSGDVLPGGTISANIHISSGAFGGIPN
jgi:hypothetical protein